MYFKITPNLLESAFGCSMDFEGWEHITLNYPTIPDSELPKPVPYLTPDSMVDCTDYPSTNSGLKVLISGKFKKILDNFNTITTYYESIIRCCDGILDDYYTLSVKSCHGFIDETKSTFSKYEIPGVAPLRFFSKTIFTPFNTDFDLFWTEEPLNSDVIVSARLHDALVKDSLTGIEFYPCEFS